MKRLLVAIAALSFTFTSCDEDEAIAEDLSGFWGKTWEGVIKYYYYDRWGYSGDYYRTAMYFESTNSTSGYGYEVDYDIRDRHNNYSYSRFRWRVRYGRIIIEYSNPDWMPLEIYDYRLNSDHFYGYMDFSSHDGIEFDLKAVRDFDWDSYHYYAKETRGAKGVVLEYYSKGDFAK